MRTRTRIEGGGTAAKTFAIAGKIAATAARIGAIGGKTVAIAVTTAVGVTGSRTFAIAERTAAIVGRTSAIAARTDAIGGGILDRLTKARAESGDRVEPSRSPCGNRYRGESHCGNHRQNP